MALETRALWVVALSSVELVRRRGLESDLRAVNMAISACEKASRWSHALELFARVRHVLLATLPTPTSTISFNAAMAACEKGAQWPLALALLLESGAGANLISWNTAASACEKGAQWSWALSLLFPPSAVHRPRPDAVSFGAAISACARAARWAWALSLLLEMPRRGLEEDAMLLNAALRACERACAAGVATVLPLLARCLSRSSTATKSEQHQRRQGPLGALGALEIGPLAHAEHRAVVAADALDDHGLARLCAASPLSMRGASAAALRELRGRAGGAAANAAALQCLPRLGPRLSREALSACEAGLGLGVSPRKAAAAAVWAAASGGRGPPPRTLSQEPMASTLAAWLSYELAGAPARQRLCLPGTSAGAAAWRASVPWAARCVGQAVRARVVI